MTNVYPTHVPNGDGGMYGDFTKRSQSDYCSRPKKGVLNQREDSSWKYPSPTKGKR